MENIFEIGKDELTKKGRTADVSKTRKIDEREREIKQVLDRLEERDVDYHTFEEFSKEIENIISGLDVGIKDFFHEAAERNASIQRVLSSKEMLTANLQEDKIFKLYKDQEHVTNLALKAIIPQMSLIINCFILERTKFLSILREIKTVGQQKQKFEVMSDMLDTVTDIQQKMYANMRENLDSTYKLVIEANERMLKETREWHENQARADRENYVKSVHDILKEVTAKSSQPSGSNVLEDVVEELTRKIDALSIKEKNIEKEVDTLNVKEKDIEKELEIAKIEEPSIKPVSVDVPMTDEEKEKNEKIKATIIGLESKINGKDNNVPKAEVIDVFEKDEVVETPPVKVEKPERFTHLINWASINFPEEIDEAATNYMKNSIQEKYTRFKVNDVKFPGGVSHKTLEKYDLSEREYKDVRNQVREQIKTVLNL